MIEGRSCTICGEHKELSFFYLCGNVYRRECKICTIKRNVAYQKKTRPQMSADALEKRRAGMREYYHKNKKKFDKYKREWLKKHPGYSKQYYQNKKRLKEKTGGRSTGQEATN